MLNYLAVLVAALASFAVGGLWHSQVGFGKQWQRMMGFNEESIKKMPLTPTQAMIMGFIATLLFAYVLAQFVVLVGATSVALSLQLGFWVWLGFVVVTLANGWLWEGKPLKLFLFNCAYQLVSIEVMALLLGLWR